MTNTCTCDIDDVGMGHATGCPIGRRNNLRTVASAIETLLRHGVPSTAVEPVRAWLDAQTDTPKGGG